MHTLALLGSATLITSTAAASVTGLTVEMAHHAATGRNVYSVWANFTSATDVINGVHLYANISGTMNALHNDNAFGDLDTDGDGYADVFGATGGWAATWNNSSGIPSDSFVAIGSPGPVGLVGAFAGPSGFVFAGISNDSGWVDTSPLTENLVGSTLRVKIMQIARAAANETPYTGSMTVAYHVNGEPNSYQELGPFQYTIPAPGALALLGFAGLPGFSTRRRRAAHASSTT